MLIWGVGEHLRVRMLICGVGEYLEGWDVDMLGWGASGRFGCSYAWLESI